MEYRRCRYLQKRNYKGSRRRGGNSGEVPPKVYGQTNRHHFPRLLSQAEPCSVSSQPSSCAYNRLNQTLRTGYCSSGFNYTISRGTFHTRNHVILLGWGRRRGCSLFDCQGGGKYFYLDFTFFIATICLFSGTSRFI